MRRCVEQVNLEWSDAPRVTEILHTVGIQYLLNRQGCLPYP